MQCIQVGYFTGKTDTAASCLTGTDKRNETRACMGNSLSKAEARRSLWGNTVESRVPPPQLWVALITHSAPVQRPLPRVSEGGVWVTPASVQLLTQNMCFQEQGLPRITAQLTREGGAVGQAVNRQ